MNKLQFFIFLILISTFSFVSNAQEEAVVQQSDLYAGFDAKMPDIPYLTKSQIIENMRFYEEEKPSDDPFSGYRAFVPKSWEKAPDELIRNTIQSGYIIGEIARYYSDPNDIAQSTIKIEGFEMEHNISAKNWLLKYLLDSGYVFEGLSEEKWDRAQALGVIYNEEAIDYKDWIVAQINGKRVILLTYSSPLFLWEQEKTLQATVAKSFRMLKFAKSFQSEMVSYDVTGYVEFMYPSSWRLGNLNQNDFDRPSIKLINLENFGTDDVNNDGYIDSEQFSKGIINIQVVIYENTETSITDEIEAQKIFTEGMGVKADKKMRHSMEIIFPSSTDVNQLDIYEGTSVSENSSNYEIWVAYMQDAEAYYLVSMITPNKESRYFAWTENRNAFESIVSSLEPVSFYEE